MLRLFAGADAADSASLQIYFWPALMLLFHRPLCAALFLSTFRANVFAALLMPLLPAQGAGFSRFQ